MIEELFKQIYDKIKLETGNDSVNNVAKHLGDFLMSKEISGGSDRNLSRYFDEYIFSKYVPDHQKPINPKIELLDGASQYLDYNNYEHFVRENTIVTEDNSNKNLGTRVINQNGDKSIYLENNSASINIS
ncbi:hypothetical protein Q4Q35_05795 [Flavivirga aquimarina]|uniref:Uncharacterized protein n=1 Tax=Flavivirga aquimarina TaxID=2027862 RepID=A0ABT8W856_9FLAO|nr:hypothetical protein [Flavivirga aquimarina]MDO5969313.1 hypothetical protein [Flavivirga aquimarina]